MLLAGLVTAAAANKGGGGGGGANHGPSLHGAAGGSGFVGIVDPKGSLVASSCWDLRSVFKQKVAGTWY
mgnify:CR=1 FL=1